MCQTLVSTHVQMTSFMRKKVEFQTKKSGGNTSDVYSGTVRFERNPDTEWTDWDPTNVLSPSRSVSEYHTGMIHDHFLPHPLSTQVIMYVKMIKLSLYRPGQAPGVPGGRGYQNFYTISTRRWQVCQPYAPPAFSPQEIPWYSFLLEAESTPGP